MITTLEILFLLILGLLFYQDIKERKVSLWILISGVIVGGIIHFMKQDTTVFLTSVCVNLLFISLIFGVLWVYAKFKMKQALFNVFGLGDLIFFVLLGGSLPVVSFLLLFVFSLIFSLSIFLLLRKQFIKKTIPLAGLQSLFLGLIIISNKLTNNINLYAI